MDYDQQDYEIVRLLSKLKETESTYPVEMMAARRQSYIKQVAALGIGTGAALALKVAAKAAASLSMTPVASTIVESALIVAIIAEASFVAFVNRDKVLDAVRTISGQPTVEQVTAAPESLLPSHVLTEMVETEFTLTAEPTLAPTLMTEPPTLVETPSPEILVVTQSVSASGSGSSTTQVNSTPNPNGNNGNNGNHGNNNGNNGNHYGQTPRPERTKQPGNNGGGTEQNNENKNNGNGNGH